LKWLRFERIEELRAAAQKELKNLTKEVIASLTRWEFIVISNKSETEKRCAKIKKNP
jgi:hypothetical protein